MGGMPWGKSNSGDICGKLKPWGKGQPVPSLDLLLALTAISGKKYEGNCPDILWLGYWSIEYFDLMVRRDS